MAYTNDIFYWTLDKEGGLSKAKTDSASKYPAPCTITYNDVSSNEWHTNKGVQWVTFKKLADKYGYSATCSNFAKMPLDIWGKIAKYGYWDFYDLDNLSSQPIANLLFQSAYGSGNSGSLVMWNDYFKTSFTDGKQLRQYITSLLKKEDDIKLFNKMWNYRLAWLLRLPNNEANYEGWKNRAVSLYKLSTGKEPVISANGNKSLNPFEGLGIMDVGIGILIIWAGYQVGKRL